MANQPKLTREDEIKLSQLLHELEDARNKSTHYLRRGQFRTASLHFMLESTASDKINDILKEILNRESKGVDNEDTKMG